MNVKNVIKCPSTLLGLTALAFFATTCPAEAIALRYEFTGGVLSDGGSLSGFFDYDADGADTPSTKYLDWSITVSGGSNNPAILPTLTYTPINSDVFRANDLNNLGNPSAGAPNDLSQGFALVLKQSFLIANQSYREVALAFGTRSGSNNNTANYQSLPTTIGGTTTLMRSNDFNNRVSLESTAFSNTGTSTQRGLEAGITITAKEIPFETDVFPFAGATALFAGGVWWKCRRGKGVAIDSSAGNPEMVAPVEIK